MLSVGNLDRCANSLGLASRVGTNFSVLKLIQHVSSSGYLPFGTSATMSDPFAGHKIILGTTSRWRQCVFRQHFPETAFTTLSADIDEKAVTAGFADRKVADPSILTLAIANAKADALLASAPKGSLLMTSDQVLSYAGTIREKPADAAQCRQYLRGYATHPVVTVAAIVVTNTSTGYRAQGVDVARQYFRPIPEEVIDRLIEKGDVMYSAGGVTVEDELLAPYLTHREGTLDSIMGLPVELLTRLLKEAADGVGEGLPTTRAH